MIREIIELLQFQEWHNTTENIHIAKGGYRYPRTFKEIFKIARRWQLRKQ
jgi:hypothetical protein